MDELILKLVQNWGGDALTAVLIVVVYVVGRQMKNGVSNHIHTKLDEIAELLRTTNKRLEDIWGEVKK